MLHGYSSSLTSYCARFSATNFATGVPVDKTSEAAEEKYTRTNKMRENRKFFMFFQWRCQVCKCGLICRDTGITIEKCIQYTR